MIQFTNVQGNAQAQGNAQEHEQVQESEMEQTLRKAGFAEILEQRRFLLYKEERKTKVPKTRAGTNASSVDPATWCTFAEAWAAYSGGGGGGQADGIGIILGDHFGTRIVGVDLDKVRDPFSGEWTNAGAQRAAADLVTYGELSISGTGMHYLFLDPDVPEGYKTRTGKTAEFSMEIYESGRYFTLSGAWQGGQLCRDQSGIDQLYRHMPRRTGRDTAAEQRQIMGRKELCLDLDTALTRDARFAALYGGQRPFDNESEDDLALANAFVRYLGRDEALVEDAFLGSPHFVTKDEEHKQKCLGREDYLRGTIRKAVGNYYRGYSFDDVGNSEMFTDNFGDRLRFCREWQTWMLWNGKGWERGADLRAQQMAKELSTQFRERSSEYRERTLKPDKELAKALSGHTKSMRSSRALGSMIKLSASSLDVSADIFDQRPFELNCTNGIVDLRTLQLREHSGESYHSMIAGAGFTGASAPLWDGFLNKILTPSGVEYLQLCVGMAAVGQVYEEAMIFMIGAGANGKSTLANVFSHVFGQYALTLQPDVITSSRDGKTPPDFAMVRGKRIVFLSETEQGESLSTKSLKRLSSNEKVAARRLYSMPESFDPSHTIFYSTNHAPKISSNDKGVWRRIKRLPFSYSFSESEKDTSFARKVIETEADGVLRWVCEGAKKFIDQGCKIETPDFVREATREYQEGEDMIAQFLSVWTCEVDYDHSDLTRVQAASLYRAFGEFCQAEGAKAKNIREFNEDVLSRGFRKINTGGTKFWCGLQFKSSQEVSKGQLAVGTF